jgi:hypothetical protein
MICLSTSTQPMASPMSNAAQVRTHTGKYPLRSGLPFFIALTWVNHSVKLRESMASPMKQFAVFFALLVKDVDETNFKVHGKLHTLCRCTLTDSAAGNSSRPQSCGHRRANRRRRHRLDPALDRQMSRPGAYRSSCRVAGDVRRGTSV